MLLYSNWKKQSSLSNQQSMKNLQKKKRFKSSNKPINTPIQHSHLSHFWNLIEKGEKGEEGRRRMTQNIVSMKQGTLSSNIFGEKYLFKRP